MRTPGFTDAAIEGRRPDVLVIGGGISGVTIARELTKWKLDVLLADKECDLAMQASGRNDGEVHPGIDLKPGSLKFRYVRRGNQMYTKLCEDLDVPFARVGQYACFRQGFLRPVVDVYCFVHKYLNGIADTRVVSGEEMRRLEPKLSGDFKFAIWNPDAGSVCPYGLTIACGENAVKNGAQVSLSTAVLGMELENGKIKSVRTNRGTVYPRLVINAAGVFAEEIARMRTICSTVRTVFPEYPVVPVRVSRDIPKARIFDVMREINKITVKERLGRGDAVITDVLGLGADVIITGDMLKK